MPENIPRLALNDSAIDSAVVSDNLASPSLSPDHRNSINESGNSSNQPTFHFPDYSQPSLPKFNKRPLSDTPFVLNHSLPVLQAQDALPNTVPLTLLSEEDELSRSLTEPSEGQLPPKQGPGGESQNNKQQNQPSSHSDNQEVQTDTAQTTPFPSLENLKNDQNTANDNNNNNNNGVNTQEQPPTLKSLPKRRATTLDVPGLTKSRISPDGTIAQLDIASKLVIVMVGLPARGKSYITNKLARYLNWSQHECKVFNVGNTRRKTDKKNIGPALVPLPDLPSKNGSRNTSGANSEHDSRSGSGSNSKNNSTLNIAEGAASNGDEDEKSKLAPHDKSQNSEKARQHSASFFAPDNKESLKMREQWAIDTLDQLLDYILEGPGAVGIFDATNTTRLRRQRIVQRINQRSNNQLKILFLESTCDDPKLIEQNVRLKLSGPDYRQIDPEVAVKDFTERLRNYEKVYEPIGEYEEQNANTNGQGSIQYVKMINVGKKIITYNIQGFLASQTIYFLLNFNLSARLICITRHGESEDNITGRIGGDSPLTARGKKFAKTLARFISFQKEEFRKRQLDNFNHQLKLNYTKKYNDNKTTYDSNDDDDNDNNNNSNHSNSTSAASSITASANLSSPPAEPSFCVWTSMLQRAIQTAEYFNDHDFFVKEMRMLDELGAGMMEGMTYHEIQQQFPQEYEARLNDKLKYRYPGLGGELYLDVINRLKPIITEIERSEDHLLAITHRVVARILLGYFLNIDKKHIGDLDIPLHSMYILEPKTYGVDWSLWEYNEDEDWFFKMDKFKYTKRLKEINLSNVGKRKYSVVPSLPNHKENIRKSLFGGNEDPNAAAGATNNSDEKHISDDKSEDSNEQKSPRVNTRSLAGDLSRLRNIPPRLVSNASAAAHAAHATSNAANRARGGAIGCDSDPSNTNSTNPAAEETDNGTNKGNQHGMNHGASHTADPTIYNDTKPGHGHDNPHDGNATGNGSEASNKTNGGADSKLKSNSNINPATTAKAAAKLEAMANSADYDNENTQESKQQDDIATHAAIGSINAQHELSELSGGPNELGHLKDEEKGKNYIVDDSEKKGQNNKDGSLAYKIGKLDDKRSHARTDSEKLELSELQERLRLLKQSRDGHKADDN